MSGTRPAAPPAASAASCVRNRSVRPPVAARRLSPSISSRSVSIIPRVTWESLCGIP